MPKVNVSTQSNHSAQETFKRIRDLLENDRDLKTMDSGYVCQFNEAQLTGSAKGNKFQAQMRVTPSSSGCAVQIDVDLPLMLTPLKGAVQSTLEKKIAKALA